MEQAQLLWDMGQSAGERRRGSQTIHKQSNGEEVDQTRKTNASVQYWVVQNVHFFLPWLTLYLVFVSLFSETSISWGLPTGFWHDPGAVWPPGAVEEERPEEGSASILDGCSEEKQQLKKNKQHLNKHPSALSHLRRLPAERTHL